MVLKFIGEMEYGDQIFAMDKQFPEGYVHMYLTDYDQLFADTLVNLVSVLSYRTSNTAKDTNAASAAARGSRDQTLEIVNDQGVQDNTKRFEEMLKRLASFGNDDAYIWTRPVFEQRVAAVWA